jgi:hypothetical protein
MKRIVVCRCVQSENEEITSYGAMQAHGIGKILQKERIYPDLLVCGDWMCEQTATIIAFVAMKLIGIRMEIGSDFLPTYSASEMDAVHFLSRIGSTVKRALEENECARKNRAILIKAIIDLAADMDKNGENTALVVSHSLFSELAADSNELVPFGLNEGECIVYLVEERQRIIVGHHYICCAYPSHSAF